MNIFYWIVTAYLILASIYVAKSVLRGPKLPSRLAILMAIVLISFPWLRSLLSTEGRGQFAVNTNVSTWEWVMVLFALMPIQIVCIYVVWLIRQKKTAE